MWYCIIFAKKQKHKYIFEMVPRKSLKVKFKLIRNLVEPQNCVTPLGCTFRSPGLGFSDQNCRDASKITAPIINFMRYKAEIYPESRQLKFLVRSF